ncbi:hypothetical protein ACE1CI_15240, partial [Aerosakkonemataceae cyanobacterium BLCC-F50]
AIAHFVRNAGNDVCLTNTISLRSRMMRKYQVRFWRATALVRESLTLIIRDEGLRMLEVGHTSVASGERVRPSKGTAFVRHHSVKEESHSTA